MKKLMTMLLGLAFLTGTVAFAQQEPPKAEKGAKKGKASKKASKKKGEEPKKG
jgi:hypothetical protein